MGACRRATYVWVPAVETSTLTQTSESQCQRDKDKNKAYSTINGKGQEVIGVVENEKLYYCIYYNTTVIRIRIRKSPM